VLNAVSVRVLFTRCAGYSIADSISSSSSVCTSDLVDLRF
jgi:hypothetical protein